MSPKALEESGLRIRKFRRRAIILECDFRPWFREYVQKIAPKVEPGSRSCPPRPSGLDSVPPVDMAAILRGA